MASASRVIYPDFLLDFFLSTPSLLGTKHHFAFSSPAGSVGRAGYYDSIYWKAERHPKANETGIISGVRYDLGEEDVFRFFLPALAVLFLLYPCLSFYLFRQG